MSAPAPADRLLDLRGLRCPWPALRVGRALREGAEPVLAVADDPLAAREIGAVAAARGWTMVPQPTGIGDGLRLVPPREMRISAARP